MAIQLIEPLDFYLIPMTPEIVFEGTIGTLTSPNTLTFTGAIATGTAPPLAGMTLRLFEAGVSDDDALLQGRHAVRVRSVPTGTTSGTIVIGEDDEFFQNAAVNDTVRIYNEFRLWPKYPRFTLNGAQVIQYEDYDLTYSNQLQLYRPTAVTGPPGVAKLNAGSAAVQFVGDQSFALSGSLTTALWRAYGSAEGTSSSFGSSASPVEFTWTQAGIWLVSLTVTDSNGNSHTAYTYAVILDPANLEDIAFLKFDNTSDKIDFAQGGATCSFTVYQTAQKSIFFDEMRILHVAFGNMTTPTAAWPHRTNLLFDGWIVGNSIRQNSRDGDVSFRATTIDGVMKNLTMWPTSLTFFSGPTEWTQAASLDVDRVCHYLYHYRSTLADVCSIVQSGYSGLIGRQDFGNQSLFQAIQGALMRSIWGQLCVSHQGVLYHEIDTMVLTTSDRSSSFTTRKALNNSIFIDDAAFEENQDYSWQANQVKASGVYYTGGDYDEVCPLFSEAPGDAPLAYGSEMSFDRLILTGQSELNQRTGYKFAQLKKRIQAIRLSFINDGSFSNVPQDRFPLTIQAADNERGLALDGDLVVARGVSRQYDHRLGIMRVDVTFEVETTGNNGVTVDMPCEPPEQETGGESDDPPFIPVTSLPASAVAAATSGSSFYVAPGMPSTFERRPNGLIASQVSMNDMIRDPWSAIINEGNSPDKAVVWACGTGFLVRSQHSGKDWRTRSGVFPSVTWGGDSAVEYTSIDFIKVSISDFVQNNVYVLGRWEATGLWRGALYYSSDGYDFSVVTLEGNTEVKPLGMAIDRGSGRTLWVTTWESDDMLYLRRLELPDLTESGKYSLGSATEAQLGDTYHAYPHCALSKIDQVFVFGRMNAPQSLSNPSHVIRSNDRGDSWSEVESGWGSDMCDTFYSDENGFYYAVRRAI